jgi:hypothetical protein
MQKFVQLVENVDGWVKPMVLWQVLAAKFSTKQKQNENIN